MEEFKKNKIEKVSSEGENWKERRNIEFANQNFLRDSAGESIQSIFGHEVLSSWEFINEKGRKWDYFQRHDPSQAVIDGQKVIEKGSLPLNTKVIKNALKEIAKTKPELIGVLIKDSLSTSTDPMIVAEKIGLVDELNAGVKKYKIEGTEEYTITPGAYLIQLVIMELDRNWEIPTEGLMYLLENHRNIVLEKENLLGQEVEKIINGELVDILINAIEQDQLPLSWSHVKERLSSFHFRIVDEMTASLQERWGDYNPNTNTIRISTLVPMKMIKYVLTHEVVHALSGQLEEIHHYQPSVGTGMHMKEVIKSGTHYFNSTFQTPGDHLFSNRTQQLLWLNEAITEEITDTLVGEAHAYPAERALFRWLITEGQLPDELVTEMYFENYTGDKEGHQLPKTREFFQHINQKFGAGFLMNLDKYIEFIKGRHKIEKIKNKDAVEDVVKLWRKMGIKFPKFINDWADSEAKGQRLRYKIKKALGTLNSDQELDQ